MFIEVIKFIQNSSSVGKQFTSSSPVTTEASKQRSIHESGSVDVGHSLTGATIDIAICG